MGELIIMSVNNGIKIELKALIESYGKYRLSEDTCSPKLQFHEYRLLLKETRPTVGFTAGNMEMKFEAHDESRTNIKKVVICNELGTD
jgi:hypothetical protein